MDGVLDGYEYGPSLARQRNGDGTIGVGPARRLRSFLDRSRGRRPAKC